MLETTAVAKMVKGIWLEISTQVNTGHMSIMEGSDPSSQAPCYN